MVSKRELLRQTAEGGKYAPLYFHLVDLKGRAKEWRATFSEVEKNLGFKLPKSARVHRPWLANQGEQSGHSHALSWEMAGWKKEQVENAGEKIGFARRG